MMAGKLMNIPNDDKQNYPVISVDSNQQLKRVDTQLNDPTNQNSIKFPTNKNTLS